MSGYVSASSEVFLVYNLATLLITQDQEASNDSMILNNELEMI
jgi:hypothetical protein